MTPSHSAMESVLNKINKLAMPVLERRGLSLYDLELTGGNSPTIRLHINRDGGVNHGDCVNVSKELSTIIEVENVFGGSFIMEVSSPGLTRKLKKPEHFEKSAGSMAKIVFRKDFEGPREALGTLEHAGDGRYRLVNRKDGKVFEFEFCDVANARLELET